MTTIRHEFNFQDLKASDRLPTPSGTALAILRLTQSDDATARSVAELVQTDPALSGRILKFANSATISPRRPIISIQDAVQLLGMSTVGQFAISLSIIGRYQKGPCQNFDYPLYWSFALIRAVAFQAISGFQRITASEEAFSIGLLADIGKLAMATLWPEAYSKLLADTPAEQLLLVEQHHFAINHLELSLLLLADWGFPAVFLESLKQKQFTELVAGTRSNLLTHQLVFAEYSAKYCLGDAGYRQTLEVNLKRLADPYGLQKDELRAFLTSMEQQWRTLGELINVSTETRLSSPASDAHSLQKEMNGIEVLLVCDEESTAESLVRIIREYGYTVSLFKNKESALAYFLDHKPGPVIIILYSGLQGWEATDIYQSVLGFSKKKSLYLIHLAAKGDDETMAEALECGADAFLYQPINPKVLKAQLAVGKRFIHIQRTLAKNLADIDRFNEELSATTQRLEVMANTDFLTSLPNRRYALSRLEQEWTAMARHKRPLCVLMLDLDHFKLINDSSGHAVGDEVLVHVTKVMRKSVRVNDILCRLGGEEFLVIAPDTDRAAVLVLAERMRSAIEQQQPEGLKLQCKITVSIGAASPIPQDVDIGWENLLKRADQAMYHVKNSGRNGVQFVD